MECNEANGSNFHSRSSSSNDIFYNSMLLLLHGIHSRLHFFIFLLPIYPLCGACVSRSVPHNVWAPQMYECCLQLSHFNKFTHCIYSVVDLRLKHTHTQQHTKPFEMCIRHDYVQRPKIQAFAWLTLSFSLFHKFFYATYVFCTCLKVNVFRVYFIWFTFLNPQRQILCPFGICCSMQRCNAMRCDTL